MLLWKYLGWKDFGNKSTPVFTSRNNEPKKVLKCVTGKSVLRIANKKNCLMQKLVDLQEKNFENKKFHSVFIIILFAICTDRHIIEKATYFQGLFLLILI